MQYYANGYINIANDSVNGNWTYGYDGFGRLESAAQAAGPAYTYKYDRYGNRWNQSDGTQNWSVSFWEDNHIASGQGYSYDVLGNISNDGVHTYEWDAEGRLSKVDGGAAATYTYDALGRRVRAVVGSSGRSFVHGLSGKVVAEYSDAGSWNLSDIHAGGRHLATYVNSTTYFSHADWLGTARRRTDVLGNTAETCTSLPFGDGLNCTGVNVSTLDFTGHERDGESGLYHTLFRKYSPATARWLTPDLLFGDQENPQSLNRYAYVGGNPINFTDSLGLVQRQGDDLDRVILTYGPGPMKELDGVQVPLSMWEAVVNSGGATASFQVSGRVKDLNTGERVYFKFTCSYQLSGLGWERLSCPGSQGFELRNGGIVTNAGLAEAIGIPLQRTPQWSTFDAAYYPTQPTGKPSRFKSSRLTNTLSRYITPSKPTVQQVLNTCVAATILATNGTGGGTVFGDPLFSASAQEIWHANTARGNQLINPLGSAGANGASGALALVGTYNNCLTGGLPYAR